LGDGWGEFGTETAESEMGEVGEGVPAESDTVECESAEGGNGSFEDKSGGHRGDFEGKTGECGEIGTNTRKEIEHVIGEEKDIDGLETGSVDLEVRAGDFEWGR
jgi:hypothetical protein